MDRLICVKYKILCHVIRILRTFLDFFPFLAGGGIYSIIELSSTESEVVVTHNGMLLGYRCEGA